MTSGISVGTSDGSSEQIGDASHAATPAGHGKESFVIGANLVEVNYQKETAELIKLFAMHGKSHIAKHLKEAVDAASTGTEMIMSIKYHLEQVKDEDLPEILRPRVAKLIRAIGEMLK